MYFIFGIFLSLVFMLILGIRRDDFWVDIDAKGTPREKTLVWLGLILITMPFIWPIWLFLLYFVS